MIKAEPRALLRLNQFIESYRSIQSELDFQDANLEMLAPSIIERYVQYNNWIENDVEKSFTKIRDDYYKDEKNET